MRRRLILGRIALILGDNEVDEEGFFVLPTPRSALRHDFWICGLIGWGWQNIMTMMIFLFSFLSVMTYHDIIPYSEGTQLPRHDFYLSI